MKSELITEYLESSRAQFMEYVDFTPSTSIHRNDNERVIACLLGISGEFGELTATLRKEDIDSKLVYSEIGDVFYYLGLLVHTLEIKEEISFDFWDELEERKNAIYMISSLIPKLHENFKKVIRDSNWDLDVYEKRGEVIEIINRLIWGFFIMVEGLTENNFHSILEANMEKLNSRKKRGVIGGSGDER
jgi:NTP pyrophosphatase (non-canonical NTP hydrolase)